MSALNFYPRFLQLLGTTLLLNSVFVKPEDVNPSDIGGIYRTEGIKNVSSRTHAAISDDFTVNTTKGVLRLGEVSTSRLGYPFHSFYAIPYAAPPVRFQPPNPHPGWTGVRETNKVYFTNFEKNCIQDTWLLDQDINVAGSEDCLYLSVQTPDALGTESYPVIVFFHGGGFNFGSGLQYNGKYLLDRSVVFVTVNYRVGAFGFLNTGDGEIPGNMGMKDQVMALKWVRDNIGAFKGDKDRVTLLGHSAGAASALHHMISPMSQGLFHGIYALSGASLNGWGLLHKPRFVALELAQKLNCPIDNKKKMADCLKKVEARKIAECQFESWSSVRTIPFAPTIETAAWGERFITEDPFISLKKGNWNKVPVVFSINRDEGLYAQGATVLQTQTLLNDVNTRWEFTAPIMLGYAFPEYIIDKEEEESWSREIRKFYFNGGTISKDTARELINLYTDSNFVHAIYTSAKILANQGVPVWTYINDFRNEEAPIISQLGGAVTDFTGIYSASTHADELPFLFDIPLDWPNPLSSDSTRHSHQMVDRVVDFATFKYMTTDTARELPANKKFEEPDWYVLENNGDMKIRPNDYSKRMKFWDTLMNYTF